MTTTSSVRIPRADMSGPFARLVEGVSARLFGQVPDTVAVLSHHRRVLTAIFGFERRVGRWDALDPHVKTFAVMATAGSIGCSWCLDFGYFMAREEGLDLARVREVPHWRVSEAFTPLERDVMEYAEAMTATPPTVTDELSERLRAALGEKALVELVAIVAVENQRSRINAAAGLTSQGYSDVCQLPLAAGAPGGTVMP